MRVLLLPDISLLLLMICLMSWYKKWYAIGTIMFLSILTFFRIPDIRKFPNLPNALISPADGTILDVRSYKNRTSISIFLSLFDRHIQIAPTDGVIIKTKYKPGEFNSAHMFEKSKYNERLEFYIQTSEWGIVKVTCFAGLLVRKIEQFKKCNDIIKQNEMLSIIKFGSRVDISFDNNGKQVLVKKDDKIKMGSKLITT